MTQPTTYRRSLSGSVGAGMKSVFGGEGRRYYMLVHKVSSKYHKAGEAQRIIVDQIEIGRDPKCQVRFDESFTTVSRRHAAIVKDGDNWKLVQLSQTNSTYLNGRRVEKEWYLQNGDEIQLSTNGPKLGFIVPEGEKGKVSSIGLTARLNLFRKQALRPYKNALAALGCLLVLCCVGGGFWINNMQNVINRQFEVIAQGEKEIEELIEKNRKNYERIDSLEKTIGLAQEFFADEIAKLQEENRRLASSMVENTESLDYDFSECHSSVFLIKNTKITVDGEVYMEAEPNSWLSCGTGFLLSDGKFVTARHCVTSYYSNYFGINMESGAIEFMPGMERQAWKDLMLMAFEGQGLDVVYHYEAVSPAMTFEFTSKDMISDASHDMLLTCHEDIWCPVKEVLDKFEGMDLVRQLELMDYVRIKAGTTLRIASIDYTDWAYFETGKTGGLVADRKLSTELRQGAKLLILGYPSGRGEGNPILSEAMTSQNGLDVNGTIMASNDNTEGGNSGGPVFVLTESGPNVVGIVSGSTYGKGRFVPIAVIPEN